MSDEAINSGCQGGSGSGGDGMSVGALIRAAADGELTEAQIQTFEALCAERDCTKDRVRFEQTLRDACGKAMGDKPGCPDALRNKVRAIAAAGGDVGMASEAAAGSGTGSVVEAMGEQTRSVSFWRHSPGILAAAAVLALFAGVLILQGISLPTGAVPTGWTTEQAGYRDRVAGFVAKEHTRCCDSEGVSEDKLVIRDPGEAQTYFAESLGVSDVDLGVNRAAVGAVRFWGGGDCHVPGAPASGHVRFDATAPDGTDIHLSLFVVPDRDQLPIQEGMTYRVTSKACAEAGVNLFTWKRAGVVYLLVSEAQGGFCEVVRDLMHAPEGLEPF